ncbi:hypothetical protein J6590_059703 [Homalodisca vitripennis]|nr:hypothetical protein J6590_059703 [Homalodisca vitripennis]
MESEELVFLLLSHTKTEGCHMTSCPDALHMLEMYSSLCFDETESEEQDFLLLNYRGTEVENVMFLRDGVRAELPPSHPQLVRCWCQRVACVLVRWSQSRSSSTSATPKLKIRSLCFGKMESEEVFLLFNHRETVDCLMTSCPSDLQILVRYSSLYFIEMKSEELVYLLLSHTKTKVACVLVRWNRRRSSSCSVTPKLKEAQQMDQSKATDVTYTPSATSTVHRPSAIFTASESSHQSAGVMLGETSNTSLCCMSDDELRVHTVGVENDPEHCVSFVNNSNVNSTVSLASSIGFLGM